MVVNLSVEFTEIRFRNPIWLASASPGWDGKRLRRYALAGAGAVIPKSIGSPARWFEHPRCGRIAVSRRDEIPIGMQNIEIFSTVTKKAWIERELKIASEGGAPVIASIVANPDPTDTAKLAQAVARTKVPVIIELNVSCPMPAGSVGWNIGKDPKLTAEQVKAVKEAVPDVPLMPKLTPNVADIGRIARACERAGADAISSINSVRCLLGVNIETGKPVIPAFGGYTGPAILPISLRCVAEVAKSVKIPISGIGGIMNWHNVIEMMMVGARTIQIATAVIWHGPGIFKEILKNMEGWMAKKGYESTDEFVGCALKHIVPVEEIAKLPAKYAVVNAELCDGCGVCKKICVFDAIEIIEGIAKIDSTKCDGCGLCTQLCPIAAISLK